MRLTDLKHRELSSKELQDINIEDQGGVEFIYWYYDMGNSISNEELLNGIKAVLLKLQEGL